MIVFQNLPYVPLRITSPYGDRTEQVKNIPGATKWHDGVDIGRDKKKYPSATEDGGDVLAVMDGVVVEVGYNRARGNYVKLEHERENGNKVETFYQHLYSAVRPGHGRVKAGEVIGRMGKTGVGAGLHLHFELRIAGKPVDPTRYLNSIAKQNTIKLPADVQRLAGEVKKLLRFSDKTMDFLCSHRSPKELLRKILSGEELSAETVAWIRSYKHGEALLQRIEEYKKKVKGAKGD